MDDWEKGCHNCGRSAEKNCAFKYGWEANEYNNVCPGWTEKDGSALPRQSSPQAKKKE